MDLECEGPECEEIAEMATPPEEEREELKILREAIRRYEINFIEFLLLRHLDVFHPQAKPDLWWDVWYQNKQFEKEVIELHEESHKKSGKGGVEEKAE